MLKFLAANPYNITCAQIGCANSTTTIGQGFTNATETLMGVVGMLAIVFIIVAGIQMTLSAGNASRFARARETLLYSCVGLALSISAYAIVYFIAGSVNGGH